MQCVPTNMPVQREDANDVVFSAIKGKWAAVLAEIKRMHKTGRPVLVGTTSVETSELVANMLKEEKIAHEVRFALLLNRNHGPDPRIFPLSQSLCACSSVDRPKQVPRSSAQATSFRMLACTQSGNLVVIKRQLLKTMARRRCSC